MSLTVKYPFIVGLEEFLARETGLPDPLLEIAGDPSLIDLAVKRIESLLGGNFRESFLAKTSSFEAVVSFYLGLAIAGKASRTLLAMVISREVSEISRLLSEEAEERVLRVASMLGIRVGKGQARIPWIITREGRVVERVLPYSLNIRDYLELAAASNWGRSLANSFILGGKVFLDSSGLKNLIVIKARQKMEEDARRLSALESPYISQAVKRLLEEYGSTPSSPQIVGKGLVYEALPQCVRGILEKGLSGETITDEEFFLLTSFLANVGAPPKLLSELLSVQLGVDKDASLSIAVKALKIASEFKPYDCTKPPGREICSDCPGDLVKHYLGRIRARRRPHRKAQGR